MKFKKAIAIIFLLCSLVIAAFFIQLKPTGLTTLAQNEQKESIEKPLNQGIVSSKISLEIIRPTKLKVDFQNTKVELCPNKTIAKMKVTNTGSNAAERLFVEKSENIAVQNCINCSIKAIKPNETVELTLYFCGKNFAEKWLKFYSLNAKATEIKLD